jgi:HEPN domain-containing protein
MNRFIQILLVALLLPAVSAWAQQREPAPAASAAERARQQDAQSPDQLREHLTIRLDSVRRLLTVSSAARQIETEGNDEARRIHAGAKETYDQAKTAFEAGDLAGASDLLDQASNMMFSAVRATRSEAPVDDHDRQAYTNRKRSTEALLEAYQRVAREKGDPQAERTRAEVLNIFAEAERLAQAGHYRDGRVELDKAYLLVKSGIAALRGGDTLVRSLDFASKEEEYHYELDRNDTHKMLVSMLVTEKVMENPELGKRIEPFLRKAERLRGEADSAASGRDYEEAVRLLEQSTSEFIKAIRNAGVYIPG